MGHQAPKWRSLEAARWCHDDWRLLESPDFTNGEKAAIAWMALEADDGLMVNHAHQFIANAVRVSRSVLTRMMRKLEDLGAAKQVGEQRIQLIRCVTGVTQLRHPRRKPASLVTHNYKKRSAVGASSSTSSPASGATSGQGSLTQKRCRVCNRNDVPLRHSGDRYFADIDKTIAMFECEDCAQ